VLDKFWPVIVTFLTSLVVKGVALANAGFAKTSAPVKWAALYFFALAFNYLAGWLHITALDPAAPVFGLLLRQTRRRPAAGVSDWISTVLRAPHGPSRQSQQDQRHRMPLVMQGSAVSSGARRTCCQSGTRPPATHGHAPDPTRARTRVRRDRAP